MSSAPHERRAERVDSLDATLFAALGLIRVLTRLGALLDRHAPPAAAPRRTRERAVARADDESILMVLLGVVTLGERCREHLARLAASGPTTRPDPAPRKRAGRAGGLLR